MPPFDSLVFGLRIAACVVGALAAVRLFANGLYKRHRVLVIFLCFHVARSLVLLAAGSPRKNLYVKIWGVTEPIIWLLYILLVLDLYSLVLRNYRGLQTVGRWIFFISLPISIVVSAATVLPSWRNPRGNVMVFYYASIDRGVMFLLVIFILLTLLLLSWYPISLSRNMLVHTAVCTIFLISASLGYFVRTVEGDTVTRAVNLAHQGITLLCWSAWLLLLNPAGEAARVLVRRQWTADEEERLVNQLTAINSSLLRATRK